MPNFDHVGFENLRVEDLKTIVGTSKRILFENIEL